MGLRKVLVAFVVAAVLVATTNAPGLFGASSGTIWSIGTRDDSNAEFAGAANSTFVVESSPPGQFPPVLAGRGTHQTIQFQLDTPSSAYLTVLASKSAPDTGSGLQPIVNGHYLSPRWASTWQFNHTSLPWTYDPSVLNVNQGVIHLRWAIPTEHLRAGTNTITIRVVDADFGDGASPSFDVDYVSLERGTINFARPRRYVGTTDYWTNDAIIAMMKRGDFEGGGDGRVWLTYLLNKDTLDADLDMIEQMGVKASYPDVTWMYLEPSRGVWNDEVFDYYHYTFEQLRNKGVRVLAKIQYTPRWASTNPDAGNFDRYPAANEQDWINFLNEVGRRLGDVVDDWAILNEVQLRSFWQGTMPQYYVMMRDAYDALKASDRVDADGDGVAAFVVPSASLFATDQDYWQRMYDAVYPRMDAFHVHDYRWGIETGIEAIGAIDPRLPLVISEFGPANWLVDPTKVKESYPFAEMAMTAYVLRNPNSPANMVINWLFKGDPDRNAGPWPDPNEWYHPRPDDPLQIGDGYSDNGNTSFANYQPTRGGPPYVNLSLHSAGAYIQHQMWLQNLDGDQHPVEVISPAGTGQIEVSAINQGTSINVLVSNFEGGTLPVTRTITFALTSPWTSNRLDYYSADNYSHSEYVAGSQIRKSVDAAMGMVRVAVSNADNPVDAPPGLDIANPPPPGETSSIVIPSTQYVVRADARDDAGIAIVEYRIDPIGRSSYMPMSRLSGNIFEAVWDARGLTGIHTIEVRVTDSAGQTKTRARVVRVGDPSRISVGQVYRSTPMGDPQVPLLVAGGQTHWKVQLVDGTRSPYGLAGTGVTLDVFGPGGIVIGSFTSQADTGGKASFNLPAGLMDRTGVYRVRVRDVEPPPGRTYDSTANAPVETSVTVGDIYYQFLPRVYKFY